MKRIVLASLFCLWSAAAGATCTAPISGLNGSGSTITLGAVVDSSNNCWGGTSIVDGAAAANKAVVKAASTAPASTDTTLVVGLNPNNAANTVPWLMNLTQWAGGTLGAMSNYGTSPGAVLVPGMNAFVTNTPAVTQSGTWTVQPGNTPNTTPWLVTSRVVGNAGAIMDFAGQNASSPANSLLIGGQFNTIPTTITSGNVSPFQLDNAGNLLVNIKAGGGSGGTSLADNAAWTAGATAQTPMGCEYTSGGATALTTGHVGTPGCTSSRAQFTDKSSVAGTALVAAVSAYGIAPTGTEVEGVNAYVTNTLAPGAAVSASSSPVVIASDQAAVAVKAASGAIASGALAAGSISSGAAVSGAFVAGAIADLAHGQGTMSASVPVAIASNQSVADPCMFQAKTKVAFSTTSGSTQLVALSGSTKIYVCAVHFISTSADSVSFTEGTGTACATGATAVSGSTTAASGMDFPANGGMTEGGGVGTVMNTSVGGDELCLLQSGTTKIAGNLEVVQQ